ASQKFMAILADFSPFLEPAGLDEAYLDATGFESIYGSIHQMAVAIKQRIKDELGLCASVGMAGCKVVAKVASELSKPDGLLEVAAGEEASFLAPLPIAKLPVEVRKSRPVDNTPYQSSVQTPVQVIDIIRELQEKNLALAAQLGVATERIRNLEKDMRLLTVAKRPWWKKLFGRMD
ncbi:unnamed protein product, partial [marine sediment metagenome]